MAFSCPRTAPIPSWIKGIVASCVQIHRDSMSAYQWQIQTCIHTSLSFYVLEQSLVNQTSLPVFLRDAILRGGLPVSLRFSSSCLGCIEKKGRHIARQDRAGAAARPRVPVLCSLSPGSREAVHVAGVSLDACTYIRRSVCLHVSHAWICGAKSYRYRRM